MRDRVLALDPGKTTGVATYDLRTGEFESSQLDYDGVCQLMMKVASEAPHIDLVSEDFVITVQTAKNTQATWSLELIGVARMVSRMYGGQDLILQMPANAKRMMSDDMLKLIGWHKPGQGHANDAARHLGLYLLSHGWMDDRIKAFLSQ